MKKPQVIAQSENFKAIDLGSLSEISQYEFIHPKFNTSDKARIFIGELLETSGAEISFRELPPKTSIPFLHQHKTHEEIYIFLKGSGKIQVDDTVFPVREGSVVKVTTKGSRTLASDTNLTYMVVQAQAHSLNNYNVLDGQRVEGEIKIG